MKSLVFGLLFTFVFCLLIVPVFAQQNEKVVKVNHEWGDLKEVVVGTGEGLVISTFNDKVNFIYDPKFIDLMKTYGGKKASDVEPKRTKEVIAQIEGLVKLLQKRGIIVHRPGKLNPQEKKYLEDIQGGRMFIYARDPMLVIGNNIIETAIKIPMRAKEKFAYRPLLKKIAKERNANYVSVPSPSPSYDKNQIYLEGGDVLLNGYEIYVGNSGKGSNKAGIDWLQKYLGPKYSVHEIKIIPDFEHLDCVMSLVRPGLGLLCEDAIVGELPESLKDWEFINVSIEEAKKLGCNMLVLNSKTVVIDKQHHRIGEELRKRGVEVIEIPYDKVATWGGGFRCSHHPLVRESKLP